MNQLDTIKQLLENSDIVWTRYGSDTKQGLAERILNALSDDKASFDNSEELQELKRLEGIADDQIRNKVDT